jgi:hypothetical protein
MNKEDNNIEKNNDGNTKDIDIKNISAKEENNIENEEDSNIEVSNKFTTYIEILQAQNLDNIAIYSFTKNLLLISNFFEEKDLNEINFLKNIFEDGILEIKNKKFILNKIDFEKKIFFGNTEKFEDYLIGILNDNIVILGTFNLNYSYDDYLSLCSMLITILDDIDEKNL